MNSWNTHSHAIVKNLSCLMLGLVVLVGCVARAADETNTRVGETEQGAQNVESKVIKLEGKGRQASEIFLLEPGLSVFAIHHEGDSNVIVRLLDREGKSVDTLFNQIGEFEGERGFPIAESGEYLLDVAADGKWTIEIRQPRPTQGQLIPRTLDGQGYSVTEFVQLDKGLHVFKMNHKGHDRFTVNLIDRDGHRVESLVNELGKFEGSKPISIDKPGVYFLNIAGDGNWTIDVQ
jgi:hypothetical protein